MELIKECKKILKEISKEFGIEYAIIFGSAAYGRRRKDSDLDIAVKLKTEPKNAKEILRTISKISEKFEARLGIETDILLLNTANLGLKYEIFKTGKLIYFTDLSEYVEDSSEVVLRFIDTQIYRQRYYDEMLKRLGWSVKAH